MPMWKADVSLKGYLSNKERFADLFNGCLFEGVQIISPHELVEINNESNVILPDKMGKKRTKPYFPNMSPTTPSIYSIHLKFQIIPYLKLIYKLYLACYNTEKIGTHCESIFLTTRFFSVIWNMMLP